MRILLAGAGGQLGRALQAAATSHEVVALPHGRLDITDAAAVHAAVAGHAPDIVINAAAYNLVDQAETDHETAYRVNCRGPRNLAVAAAARGIPIVHISSDYVFAGDAGRPYTEDDPPLPLSRYGITKLIGEELVRNANPRHFVVRTAWLFHTAGQNFPRRILERAARGPVHVVDDQTGSPTYAPHLAEALLRLIGDGGFGTCHLAGRGAASWFELTRRLFAEMKVTAEVMPATTAEVPRPARRPAYSALTTVREPRILLPAWEEGVAAFAREVSR
ncbi:MAG: dTDP-4-dehydrorhamnose reductase [Vicinamibacteria bacterium]